jgi:DNA replication protein DnaC
MPHEKTKGHSLKAVPRVSDAADAVHLDLCPKCSGTGMEIVPDKGARICDCRRKRADGNRVSSVRLPKRYDGFHFSNYKAQNESQTMAAHAAMELVFKYPDVDRGLLFMGQVGVGKTHLAVSILKGFAEHGIFGLFYEFGSLLKEIQDSYNPHTLTSELSVLSPVLTTDVLVLDELGASKPTDWVRDTMAHVINTRYNDRKVTIFTTNYLDERRTPVEETLEDRIGTRLRSRLYEMCRTVMMDGRDYRRTFDRATAAPR